ncbi:MAG TPA: FUSC family protein [Jatrophihabitans sp.]|nr:FUSC family protein [Jatrophihabitans sp.]
MAGTDARTADREAAVRRVGTSLRRLYAEAAHLDLSQSDPVVSGRNALGLAIPLTVATALGNPLAGVAAATGALQAAFADRPGPYRLRLARMFGTAAIAGCTAVLAAALGHDGVASALLLAVLAFGAGLLISVGPSAAQVGIAATAAALVLGHIPQSPRAALYAGLLVLLGGAGQAALAIAAWPLGRHRPEREALATLYRQLAGLAAEPIDTRSSPPLGPAISAASAVLRGTGHDHGPSVEAYRVLLDEAVRARQDVLVLSGYASRLAETAPERAAALRAELRRAADLLELIGQALGTGRDLDPGRTAELLAAMGSCRSALGDSLTERAAVSRIRSLTGQLRAMVETARTGAGEGRTDEDTGRPAGGSRLRDPLAVLRANLRPGSPAARHALRLAVLVPATDLAIRAVGVQRGYWVALTILVVLRPDFSATFQRSLMRVIGTVIGLVLASLLVHYLLGDSTPALIGLVTVAFFGMRMAGPANLGLSSVFLAAVVVVLLSLIGVPAHSTVVVRLVDTAIGGGIALVAVLLWPSWERGQLPSQLAELVAAYRNYLQAMVDPASTTAQRAAARSQARLARSTAEASLDRARVEPVSSQGAVELAEALLAHSHRLVHALAALDATRQTRGIYAEVPQFRRLADAVSDTLASVEQGVRYGWRQARDLRLRALQAELAEALADRPDELPAAVIEATDRLVNSANSMVAVLAERTREPV